MSLLKKQNNLSKFYLRISCRTAIWFPYLDERLRELWDSSAVGKYELCPLTKEDVTLALKTEKLNEENFLEEVRKKDVVALAGIPLTLNMLIDIFKKDKELPKSKNEIYKKGCNKLISENDPSKVSIHNKPKLDTNKRLYIAERIAAVMMIGNKSVLVIDEKHEDLKEHEININEITGKEYIEMREDLYIGKDEILEVLNTGIFSSRGDGRMGWAHQTFNEYFCANYLNRHNLEWPQLRSLIFHNPLKDDTYKIPPQLYEMGAWLASLNQDFFQKLIEVDPEVLLLSDVSTSDLNKSNLMSKLLDKLNRNEIADRPEIFNYENYLKLNHSTLSNQLVPYFTNKGRNSVVRRCSLDIAIACQLNDIDDALLNIAIDLEENIYFRAKAVRALEKSKNNEIKRKLKEILKSDLSLDKEDELKGSLLLTLWPDFLSITEMLAFVTVQKASHFYGTYYRYFQFNLLEKLKDEDIPYILDWLLTQEIDSKSDYIWRKLSDKIVLRALNYLKINSTILSKLSDLIYKRLVDFRGVIEESSFDDDINKQYEEFITTEEKIRRTLIVEIIERINLNNTDKTRKKAYILRPSDTKLILPNDIYWLAQLLEEEPSEEKQQIYTELIHMIFDVKDVNHINLICHISEKNKIFSLYFYYFLQPVNLSSLEAKEQKIAWENHLKWESQNKQREDEESEEIREIKKHISIDVIKEFIADFDNGNIDAFWKLNINLCRYRHHLDDGEFSILPGWKIVSEELRKKIIQQGKKFIEIEEAKPEKWLGRKKIYFPAVAGYRVFAALFEYDPNYLNELDKKIWEKWASILVGLPIIEETEVVKKLSCLAYQKAPDEVLKALKVILDVENKHHQRFFFLSRFRECSDDKLNKFLLQQAKSEIFDIKASFDILEYLMSIEMEEAKKYVKSMVVPISKLDEKNKVIFAGGTLLRNISRKDWPFFWKFMNENKDISKEILLSIDDYQFDKSTFVKCLNEEELSDFWIWITKEFPHNDDYESQDEKNYSVVTPKKRIHMWSDSILRAVMDRGTLNSVKAVEKAIRELPNLTWLKTYTLPETKKIALAKTWKPISTEILFRLIENHKLRIINTSDELLETVIESLNRLQIKLQEGEPPQAIWLWNEKRESKKIKNKLKIFTTYSPKDENRLSEYIKSHLSEDLKDKKIISNREVEIRRGSETDIHIDTFSLGSSRHPISLIKVIIETKGCWNNKLESAMSDQLVSQYLNSSDCKSGIYLIGWYGCDLWNDPTTEEKKRKCVTISIDDAKKKYIKQAESLSQNDIKVKAIILDLRLK